MQTSLPTPSQEVPESMKNSCEHQSDCLKFIQSVLDGAASEQDLEKLKRNLESCQPCIRMYHLEKEMKALLQNKMEKRCCPEKIIDDIRSRIATFN
jgi:anti-sigma factor (TIGR02949 family)